MSNLKGRAKRMAATAATHVAHAGLYAKKNPQRVLQAATALYSFGHAVRNSPVTALSMASVVLSRLLGDEPTGEATERSAQYIRRQADRKGMGWVMDMPDRPVGDPPPIKVEVIQENGSRRKA